MVGLDRSDLTDVEVRTAGTWQHGMITRTGHLGHYSRERTGQPEYDSKDRMAGTGVLRPDSRARAAESTVGDRTAERCHLHRLA
jgi:hypothetical protein